MKHLIALLLAVPALALAQAAPPEPTGEAGKPAAAPAEPATAAQAAEPEAGGPAVADAKLGTGVVDREPEGVADSFKADVGKVYCWTKVTGAEGSEITHAWYKGDEKMGEVKLAVKYPSTRTWSAKTIPPDGTGDWRVDVVAADGTVLKSLAFKVEWGPPGRRGSQTRQDLLRPGLGVHLGFPRLDAPVGPDHHPGPSGGRRRGRVGGAIGQAHGPVHVAQQGVAEPELLGEGPVLGGGVEADAEDDGALLLELGLEVAEPATLDGSAGGVGLGVEPEHHGLPAEPGQRDGPAEVVLDREVGGGGAWLQHADLQPEV